jgi:hypothetical protein
MAKNKNKNTPTPKEEVELPEGATQCDGTDDENHVCDDTDTGEGELPEGAVVPAPDIPAPVLDPESKQAKAAAKKAEREAKAALIRKCLCGCGRPISNKGKSVFAQGHDMQVKKAILENLRNAHPNLFEGVNDGCRAYACKKWAGYIVEAIDRYITAPRKKEHSALPHFNKLHYLTFLDNTAPADSPPAE